jgi:hypothetical protein
MTVGQLTEMSNFTGFTRRSGVDGRVGLKLMLNKIFWEELVAYLPWYDTGHIENDILGKLCSKIELIVTQTANGICQTLKILI